MSKNLRDIVLMHKAIESGSAAVSRAYNVVHILEAGERHFEGIKPCKMLCRPRAYIKAARVDTNSSYVKSKARICFFCAKSLDSRNEKSYPTHVPSHPVLHAENIAVKVSYAVSKSGNGSVSVDYSSLESQCITDAHSKGTLRSREKCRVKRK